MNYVMTDDKRPAVFLQDACLQHSYIRSRDLSAIVERPERLRAVTIGISAAIARLELALPGDSELGVRVKPEPTEEASDPNDLTAAMGRMNLAANSLQSRKSPVSIFQSNASIDILTHPAVKFIHSAVDGDSYLRNLKEWAEDSWDKIHKGESEIPVGLLQGDLYLCPGSINAIQGAIGTVCEAIDQVIRSSRVSIPGELANQSNAPLDLPVHRAFVAVRPPGHHCGEDSPSGFCFVNNVAIGAAHAHLQHGINRIVILDIDLHHGNGTQTIAWRLNEETYRQTLETQQGGTPPTKHGPQIYYGSVHDILSYPCENGKPELVQAASVSLHKSHGQYIENVHLQTYTSERHFWDVLYNEQYSKLLRKAEEFLDGTGGPGDDVMVFISCGMDACEHEYASMSRHDRKVPTSFYYRFTRDVCAFSDQYARGRVVSVLEGGYSDRALIGGAMAHVSGLVGATQLKGKVEEEWWSIENLVKLENATKRRKGGRQSLSAANSFEPWLDRTISIFTPLDTASAPLITPSSSRGTCAPSSRTLRERKGPKSVTPVPLPAAKHSKAEELESNEKTGPASSPMASKAVGIVHSCSSTSVESDLERPMPPKKLPRVILRLGPEPSTLSR